MFEFSPFIRKPVNCFQFGHVFLKITKVEFAEWRACSTRAWGTCYTERNVWTLFYDDVLSHLFFFKIVLQFRDTRQFDNRQKPFQCKPPSLKSEDAHVIIKESKDLLIFFPEEAVFSVGDLVKVFRSPISNQSSTGYSHVFGDLYIKPFGLFEVSINMVNMPTYQSTCWGWSACQWRLWQKRHFQRAQTSAWDPDHQTLGASGRWTGWRHQGLECGCQ